MAPDSYLDRQVNQGLRSVKKSPGRWGTRDVSPSTHPLTTFPSPLPPACPPLWAAWAPGANQGAEGVMAAWRCSSEWRNQEGRTWEGGRKHYLHYAILGLEPRSFSR